VNSTPGAARPGTAVPGGVRCSARSGSGGRVASG